SPYLEKRGPGIHHMALSSKDILAQEAILRKNGVKLIYEEPKKGAHGTKVNFIHPKASKGPLIELVQC
ncbi:MAG TPA: VOC family protein, partial [Myxococcota bacterium]|nr:VOC family protein [Myxococcota bacterium]